MRGGAVPRRAHRSLALILGGVICLQWIMGSFFPLSAGAAPLNLPDQGGWVFLPLVLAGVPPQGRLCRFGVGAPSDIATYRVNDLRIGWYADWGSSLKPARPGGIEYLQMVRLHQPKPGVDTYTAYPSGATLLATIAANPGAVWIIGNEPDRPDFAGKEIQDNLQPQVYAIAYHDLYHQIKEADPTSRVAAGSIVQPTPLRLQYLDAVLSSYHTRYGVKMPVDMWNIHAFILNEQSCNPACPGYDNCWGADIPPGISACTGETYTIQQNDDLTIFKQFIVNFRQWMVDNDYQDRPLIITEFGVLMPENIDPDYPPFDARRVNAFMNATFDYLSAAAGPSGYGADKGRLVQAWAWYSLSDKNFNGWLFDPVTRARTAYGDNFAAYTAHVTPHVNLTPLKIWVDSSQTPLALVVSVSNNGNIELPATTAVVRFYNGDPETGGVPIGSDQLLPPLNGCANTASVRTPWTSAVPGTTRIWVVVDPGNVVTESDETDNRMSASVVVPS